MKPAAVLISLMLIGSPGALAAKASWYSSAEACGPKTNNRPGCPTASGKGLYALEKEGIEFCASNDFGIGARLKITNEANGRSAACVVLDRGGFKKYGREIDLSRKVFARIADLKEGVIDVKIERINP